MNANFLKNAFDRLGNQGSILGEIQDNTAITAASVTKGGDLYSRIDSLVTVLEKITTGKGSGDKLKGLSVADSIAIALVAPATEKLGKGLSFVVDALNRMDAGGEEKAKALEAVFGLMTKLGEVGKSVLVFAGYMILATPLLLIAMAALPIILPALYLLVGTIVLVGRMLDKETMENVSNLKKVAWGVLAFAGAMALISFIAPQAIKGVVTFVVIFGLFILGFRLIEQFIGVANPEYFKQLGDSLLYLGLGVLSFVGALALISFIGPYALKGLMYAMITIIPILGIFWLMEYMGLNKSMEDSAKALAWAGLGILSVGLALAIFNMVVPDWGAVWNTIAVLGAVALTFAILGIFENNIKKGAIALLWASLAMVAVGIGFLILGALFPASEMSLETFAPLLIIGAVAVVFALAGVVQSQILQGAVALIVAGISMILLGVGLLILSKPLEKGGWEFIGQVGALIAMIAIEFGLLGLAAPFILAGAAAMLVSGIALILLGGGVAVMAGVMKMAGDLTTADDNGDTPIGKLVNSIGDAFSMWPWRAAGILLGAGAMIVAGTALVLVGVGVKQFAKLAEDVDLPEMAQNISRLIGALAVPFSVIGGGGSLNVIDPVTGKEVAVKFSGGSGGFFGLGGSNPVSMGVMAVMNMGRALSNIAAGVQSMAMLKFPTGFDKDGNATGYNKINAKDISNVVTNTQYLVGGLAYPFAQIGKGGTTTIKDPFTGAEMEVDFGAPSAGGLMGFLTGGGDVQKGIHAVMNMGQALSNIAQGVQEMAMLKMPTGFDEEGKPTGFVKFNSESAQLVTSNTQMLVSALAGTFAEIGAKPEAQSSWWGGKSTIQKGIDLVSGMGTPLFNLAKGVQEMANLKFAKSFDKDGNVTEWYTIENLDKLMPKIENNSIKLIKALTNVFTKLGEGAPKGRGWTFWKPTNFEKGIALVERIADPFAKLAEAARMAGEVTKSVDDADKMHHTVKSMIDAIMGSGEAVDIAALPFRITLIDAIAKAYTVFETAIPAIVTATKDFKPELGKSFMSIFGGETTPETFAPKMLMLNSLKSAYGKMGDSIPKITSAIGTINPELVSSFSKLIGGSGFLDNMAAKTAMYIALGMTWTQIGAATPRITESINSLDDHKAKVFSGIFINKEAGGLFSNKYEDQTVLWNAIGRNMTLTSVAMPKIAEGINNMDLAKLTEARTMFEALGVLANGGAAEDILAEMGESLEQAMQRLADILKEFQTAVGEGNEANATIPEKIAGALGGVVGAFKDGASGGGDGGNSREVVNAITQLNRALIKNGVKISNIDDLLG